MDVKAARPLTWLIILACLALCFASRQCGEETCSAFQHCCQKLEDEDQFEQRLDISRGSFHKTLFISKKGDDDDQQHSKDQKIKLYCCGANVFAIWWFWILVICTCLLLISCCCLCCPQRRNSRTKQEPTYIIVQQPPGKRYGSLATPPPFSHADYHLVASDLEKQHLRSTEVSSKNTERPENLEPSAPFNPNRRPTNSAPPAYETHHFNK